MPCASYRIVIINLYFSADGCRTQKGTNMLQSTYENWQLYPPILCGLLCLLYYVYVFPCCKCQVGQKSRQALQQKLASLSLKILFNHESLAEAKEKVEKSMRDRVNAFVRVQCDALFSSLPLVLIWMAFTVFWNKFLIYEIDHGCSINDNLDCFFNSSGSLTCSAVLELVNVNSTYRCYRFSFDIVNGAAAAGGMFTVTVLLNVMLVKCFICCRYTTDSPKATKLFQLIMIFVILALFLAYVFCGLSASTDSEKLMQMFTIYLCCSFCCYYPWYVMETSRYDDDFAWIPCLRNKKQEYESINGENEVLTGRAWVYIAFLKCIDWARDNNSLLPPNVAFTLYLILIAILLRHTDIALIICTLRRWQLMAKSLGTGRLKWSDTTAFYIGKKTNWVNTHECARMHAC